MTAPTRDPELEGFLALSTARLAPRTVEAYRRDLEALAGWLGHSPSTVTTEELERYLAELPPGVGLLVVRHGPDAGSSYRIDQPLTSIGRSPDSDIFLDDITVSRRHVIIQRDEDGLSLHDVGSLNGTYVNHERVDEARLHYGDEVQIGRYQMSVVVGGEREG